MLALLRRDDERGMALIFKEFYAFLCQTIARLLGDEHVAEDLAQDVLFELWKRRDVLQINSTLRGYLRRSAVNKTLNYIRDRKIRWDDEDRLTSLPTQLSGADRLVESAELGDLIDKTIDGLPERCRLIFTLSRFEEMTYQEIADHLEISIKTVENQMTKALRVLRETLEPVLKGG